MRIDRLLAITIILLNRQKVTARELAGHFEVSVRTIYRDIDAIDLAGIPIISYPGNNGGFGVMENYKLERQVLSLNDMLSILTTLKGISSSLDNTEINKTIAKVSSLIPQDAMVSHVEQFAIDILPWGYRDRQKKYLQIIHQSIRQHKLIRFDYCNNKGEYLKRTIEPMTLLFKGYAWYLFAYCLLRKDFRLFRISRIHNLVNLNKTFTRKNKSYQDFLFFEDKNLLSVVLKFSPDARARVEDYFAQEQIQKQADGTMIVRAAFPEDEWVISFILSFGDDVEVLKPDYVRKNIIKKLKKILRSYKPDTQLSQE